MRIPHQTHQFAQEHALLLVAGKQDALLYDAHDGALILIDSLRIARPQYSDNEGHFKARSQGAGAIRSGSVREVRDQEIISEFIRELKDHLSRVRAEAYSTVYVTAPSKSKNEVIKALPSALKSKLKTVVEGNYNHTNPLKIIDKIFRSQPGTPEPRTEEADAILKRSEPHSPH